MSIASGCVATRAIVVGPRPLPAPMAGCYEIVRNGRHVGVERFELDRPAPNRWRAHGTTLLVAPNVERMSYEVVLDSERRTPIALAFSIEVEGMVGTATGRLEGDGFRVDAQTPAGGASFVLPFARGTHVFVPTPVLDALPINQDGGALDVPAGLDARVLSIAVPYLVPTIERVSYRQTANVAGLRSIDVTGGGRSPAQIEARPDGLPVFVRTEVQAGAPFEIALREVCEDPAVPGTIEVMRDGKVLRSLENEVDQEPTDPE